MREFLRIFGLGMLAAVTYGVLHDLVTAHLCVEYFTVAHIRILETEEPVAMALVCGVLATWWVGACQLPQSLSSFQ